MQLNPRETFSIVRQIEDHTDTSTYYVRAVIRNAKTDAIIQVNGNNYLNLVDRGSQRFSQTWQVPADPSGQGFYVSILTSVYTDSGYTTKSQNYGDKMETYLIQDRMNANLGGVGGGPDIDYKKIRRIVEEVVKETNKPVVFPKIPEVKIPEVDIETPLKEAVDYICEEIKNIKMPQPEKLEPVLKAFSQLEKTVKGLVVTEDVKKLESQLGEISKEVKQIRKLKVKVPDLEFDLEEPELTPKPNKVSPYQDRIAKLL